jgi:O-antigen ligase
LHQTDWRLHDERLRFASAATPTWHALHLLIAIVFCATAGLSTSTLQISAGLLLGIAIIRLPTTWRVTLAAGLTPTSLLATAFVGWNAMSLLWSSQPRIGFDLLVPQRMLVIALALAPLALHRVTLAWALVLGMGIQLVVQLSAVLALIDNGGRTRYVGLASHPGHLTLWFTFAATTALALTIGSGGRRRLLALGAGLANMLGATLAFGRGSLIGMYVALGSVVVIAAKPRWSATRIVVASLLLALSLGAVVAAFRPQQVASFAQKTFSQLNTLAESGEPGGTVGFRAYWWRLAAEQWLKAPVVGQGLGSFAALSAPTAGPARPARDGGPTAVQPHSTLLQTLCETGLIGGALLLLMITVPLVTGIRAWMDRAEAVSLAGAGCLLAWGVAALFDGFHVSSRSMAALALAFSFAVAAPSWAIRKRCH